MGDEHSGVPAAPGSALAGLRERREKAVKALYLDLQVPRLDPPVYVRYGPLPKPIIDQANKQIVDGKAEDREVVAKAVALSHVCLGVFGLVDGKPEGSPNTWPKFDPQLAELLGLPSDCGAVQVVRSLYLTDGDILAALAEVSEWSAQSERRISEETEGN